MPALVKKDIGTLFLPGKAVFLDLLQKQKLIFHAKQGSDGLFYITENKRSKSMESINVGMNVQSIMSSVDGHCEGTDSDFTDKAIHGEDEETSRTEDETQETST